MNGNQTETSGQAAARYGKKLRIGDNWNAIRIIALSQSNPLKAVAEFVENSIDAKAKRITLIRGKEKGVPFLRIKDDGQGVPRNAAGAPDFDYVATHICDSVKRRLKADGATGLQGEFGIGLLGFWTVGEELTMVSSGSDGKAYQMRMRKGEPGYQITPKRQLVGEPGTELCIRNILPGIKQFSGEKIQWYLASELRDRIRHSGVEIRVIDRAARTEHKVEPRQYEGRLLHQLSHRAPGESYLELYLACGSSDNMVSLFRNGTRVVDNLAVLDEFAKPPWNSGLLQGIVDAPRLNLTPGTRSGIVQDDAYARLVAGLGPVAEELTRILEEQRKAEEERTSREVLRSIQKAIKEALLALPAEEYDWFDVHDGTGKKGKPQGGQAPPGEAVLEAADEATVEENGGAESPQRQFFEYAGPLLSVRIAPASSVVATGAARRLRGLPRDRANRLVEENVLFRWVVVEGEGTLENATGEIATFTAPTEPGLARVRLTVRQGEIECAAEALLTVTQSLLPEAQAREGTRQGIPSYTFHKAPGELWRSRHDPGQNLIVINNGHRDFVYASRSKVLKLRYISRLFAKELVAKNFPGLPPGELLERLIELSLYTEENLK